MKCLRFVWTTVLDCRKQTGPPDAGNNLRKSHFIMCLVTKYSTILGVFQQLWPGVSPIRHFERGECPGDEVGHTVGVNDHLHTCKYLLKVRTLSHNVSFKVWWWKSKIMKLIWSPFQNEEWSRHTTSQGLAAKNKWNSFEFSFKMRNYGAFLITSLFIPEISTLLYYVNFAYCGHSITKWSITRNHGHFEPAWNS